MPMNCGQLETIGAKNARVVPVGPNVKSAKTCKLFNAGVREITGNGKTTDPTCYNVSRSKKGQRHAKD
jgi:hypothetical protein